MVTGKGDKVASTGGLAAAGAVAAGVTGAPTEPEWRDIASAPFGVPVRVRAGDEETVAIRDPYVKWFNAARSGGITFEPEQWAEC